VEAEERADGVRDTAEDATPTALDAPDPRATAPDADGRADPHDRCRHHPGRAAVARCGTCGDPVCLSCAVPVRGRILGPGCVAEELGDPALTMPPEPDVSVPGAAWALAGALLALLATVAPWTRAGSGARLLGAWVPNVRWSTIAALGALVLVVVAWWFRASGSRAARTLVIVTGLLVVVSSALAIAFPPIFQVASWAPWAAAGGGAIAAGAAIASSARERRPTQGV
jgi:hypothetical protein